MPSERLSKMKSSVSSFQPIFNSRIEEAQKFAIFVRGQEFQIGAISDLGALIVEIQGLKKLSIELGEEDEANAFLALELMAQGVQKELVAYVKMKSDEAGAAWDALVDAERDMRNAMRAHRVAKHLASYIARIIALQELLFPKQRFFSSAVLVESSTCSICHREYGECGHIVGRPYMGELCAQIVGKATIGEFSLVENPSDKSCRVTSFSKGGRSIDVLTLRVLPTTAETSDVPPLGTSGSAEPSGET